MKDRLLNIQLTNEVQPKVTENKNHDWVSYGDGEYLNNYPKYLIDLYNNSATHAAVVNATAAMIAGEDLIAESDENLQQYVELQKFLGGINGKETAHDIFTKVAFDLKLQGAFALNIIYSKDRTRIAEVHHIPVEQLRVGSPDENGVVRDYYLSADWSQYRKKEYAPKRVAAFNANDRREGSQIFYTGLYSPAMELYHTPDYVASTNWIQVDNLTSDFHLNNIANGFSGSYFINFANGIPTQEERHQIEKQITKKFTGANNAGKFVLTFSDDATSRPEIVPIQVSNADKQYTVLNELCIQNIMIGHRVTSPMLLGVKTEGQLGGRNELTQAYELYMNTVIKPYQNVILRAFKRLLAINRVTIPFGVKDTSPLNSLFGADVLKDVLTQDELRNEMGFEPITSKVSNSTTDAISTISPLVATKVLDNMSAEEIRELIGLKTPEEQKIKINETKNADNSSTQEVNMSEQVDFDAMIEGYGEDENLEEWDLIDEEDATDEHPDFDFEYNLEKLQLARTGRAIPNAKSEQDGTSKQNDNKYRVRYVYTKGRGFGAADKKTGKSRGFCEAMMSASKVYRKEDILRMEKNAVNAQWSKKGSSKYSIWKFKGGGDCMHLWYRRIYVQKGKKASSDDTVITTTKARSEGFKPEVNAQEVPVAPKNMPNRGFVTKQMN